MKTNNSCGKCKPTSIPKCNDMECWAMYFMLRRPQVAAAINLLKEPDGRQRLVNGMGTKFAKMFDKFRQGRNI